MAALTSIVAAIGLAVGVAGVVASRNQARKAQAAADESAKWQEQTQAENAASNAREAAVARRQQIREERIKRAQILQASETAGTSDSSGELGATGGMATQLGSNMGQSQGMYLQGQRISYNNQAAANWASRAGTYQNRAGLYNSLSNVGFGLMHDARAQAKAGKQTFSLF